MIKQWRSYSLMLCQVFWNVLNVLSNFLLSTFKSLLGITYMWFYNTVLFLSYVCFSSKRKFGKDTRDWRKLWGKILAEMGKSTAREQSSCSNRSYENILYKSFTCYETKIGCLLHKVYNTRHCGGSWSERTVIGLKELNMYLVRMVPKKNDKELR